MVKELQIMEKHHNKVFVLFFNLHLLKDGFIKDIIVISQLMRKLKPSLAKKYKIKRMGYTWTREQNDGTYHKHYHATLILDGSKINSSYKLSSIINVLWNELTEGHVAYLDNRFYNLRRGNTQRILPCCISDVQHAKTDLVYMRPATVHRNSTS
ncbi:inovirus Gp2 family protein [Vibrio sp. 99-8-1]|nr:inovirus Gp2 family protein [Vibrio sp. 99-8-1]